jgi:hypothetical protein
VVKSNSGQKRRARRGVLGHGERDAAQHAGDHPAEAVRRPELTPRCPAGLASLSLVWRPVPDHAHEDYLVRLRAQLVGEQCIVKGHHVPSRLILDQEDARS